MRGTKKSSLPTAGLGRVSQDGSHLECGAQVASEELCSRAHGRSRHLQITETCDQAVRSLIKREGPLVSVQRLKALLEFKSAVALNRAIERESFALSIFRFGQGTEGFALTAEVGWHLQQGKPRGSRGLQLAIREGVAMSE